MRSKTFNELSETTNFAYAGSTHMKARLSIIRCTKLIQHLYNLHIGRFFTVLWKWPYFHQWINAICGIDKTRINVQLSLKISIDHSHSKLNKLWFFFHEIKFCFQIILFSYLFLVSTSTLYKLYHKNIPKLSIINWHILD